MRSYALIAALPLLALTACGGASAPQTAGSVAPPTSGGTGGNGTGGTGGGIGSPAPVATPTPSPSPTPTTPGNFLDVAGDTTFSAVGSFQTLAVGETGDPQISPGILYQGNASTVRSPSGTVAYSPRDGIFTISFNDTKAGIASTVRFQDPGHRSQPKEWGVPILDGFNYINSLGPSFASPSAANPADFGREDHITFFYQRPGAQTAYVSLAGYVRNAYTPTDATGTAPFMEATTSNFDRGVMVFGAQTQRSQIPLSGSSTYSGGLLATMVVNTSGNSKDNYFQWITGTTEMTINFGNSTITNLVLSGTVSPANYAGTQFSPASGIAADSIFRATGSGTIDLAGSGGFTGRFSTTPGDVTFTSGSTVTNVDFAAVSPGSSTAGGNSIDGTFFGPNAVNVGGNLRIVGGVPNQRVDILGAFTGAKK